jgi:sugar fermentation stimulation protein A
MFSKTLETGRFLRRYKRFLCDIEISSGEMLTMHCPNTGSMKNCCYENAKVWFSRSDNLKRKYPHTWEMIEDPKGNKIGINTHLANDIVVEALEKGKINSLKGFKRLKKEVPYGEEKSRVDILLEFENKKQHFIEVKSVTLLEEDGWGYFPDAVSTRGQKHLRELMLMCEQGHSATLFFCIQHQGISKLKAARHIDSDYAELLKHAREAGVLVLAYKCHLDAKEIYLDKQIPFVNE